MLLQQRPDGSGFGAQALYGGGLIASVAGDVALLETATQRTESRLRRIERRRLVSESGLVDAEEFEELSRIERELEDGLRATP